MSYEKIAAAGAVPKHIVFYFTVASVFSNSQNASQHRARNVKAQDGQLLIDEFAITQDEETLHADFMKNAMYGIFVPWLKFSTGLPNALQHNVDYTPAGGTPAKMSLIKILDKAGYDDNYLSAISEVMFNAICFHILMNWFDSKKLQEEVKSYAVLYATAIRDLKNYSFQLKKAAI